MRQVSDKGQAQPISAMAMNPKRQHILASTARPVLAAHCEAIALDPGTIERSVAISGEIATGRDCGALISRGQAPADLGVTLLTIGCDGPDYDLTGAGALCRWRDTR